MAGVAGQQDAAAAVGFGDLGAHVPAAEAAQGDVPRPDRPPPCGRSGRRHRCRTLPAAGRRHIRSATPIPANTSSVRVFATCAAGKPARLGAGPARGGVAAQAQQDCGGKARGSGPGDDDIGCGPHPAPASPAPRDPALKRGWKDGHGAAAHADHHPAPLSMQAPTGAAPSNSLRQDRQNGCAGQDAQRCRCAAPPPAAGHARKRFSLPSRAGPVRRPARLTSPHPSRQACSRPRARCSGRAVSERVGPPWISSSRIRSRPAWLRGGRHGRQGGSWERHGRLRAVTPV